MFIAPLHAKTFGLSRAAFSFCEPVGGVASYIRRARSDAYQEIVSSEAAAAS